MSRRNLGRYLAALVLLGLVLGLISGRFSDPASRRIYLLALVVLYALALLVSVIVVVRRRLRPQVRGILERYLETEAAPINVPEEVSSLTRLVRTGRRSQLAFESTLRLRIENLASEDPVSPTPATEGDNPSTPPAPTLWETIAVRLRRGPSIEELDKMLEHIEEN